VPLAYKITVLPFGTTVPVDAAYLTVKEYPPLILFLIMYSFWIEVDGIITVDAAPGEPEKLRNNDRKSWLAVVSV
jgi:hypothetical protein